MVPAIPIPPAVQPAVAEVLREAARRYRAGQPREALSVCQAALKTHADNAQLLALAGTLAGELDELPLAVALLDTAAQAAPGHAGIQLNHAVALERSGDRTGAMSAFARATGADPRRADAWFGLARLLQQDGQQAEAADAFQRVIAIEPGHPGARHMADALAGANPAEPPREHVRALFDGYAKTFDDALVADLDYQAPALLRTAITESGRPAGGRFGSTLDLGCGTGLAGAALADIGGSLDGIDLSPEMVRVAGRRGIYRSLAVADVVDHLRSCGGAGYGLVAAADVLVYLGDLSALFAAVPPALAPDGIFAFTVEHQDSGTYRLRPSGRYAHAEAYIRGLAADAGLIPLRHMKGALRRDRGEPVLGSVYVLQRSRRNGGNRPA